MKTDPTRKPTFHWQGLLIILPAILLAGVGFISLRQDRILAQHEVTEQAKKIAGDLAQVLLPQALTTSAIASETVLDFRATGAAPEEDPILVYAKRSTPRVACLLSEEAALEYPPPIAPWPDPQPLEIDELDEQQRLILENATRLALSGSQLETAADLVEQFLATEPSEPFAAIAGYKLAVLSLKQGEYERAAQLFQTIIDRYPESVGEAGFPLKPYAELQLVQLLSTTINSEIRKIGLLSSICARAVREPSPISRFVLDQAREAESKPNSLAANESRPAVAALDLEKPEKRQSFITDRWLGVWQAHEEARVLYERFRQTINELDGQSAFESRAYWINLDDDAP